MSFFSAGVQPRVTLKLCMPANNVKKRQSLLIYFKLFGLIWLVETFFKEVFHYMISAKKPLEAGARGAAPVLVT